MSRHTPTSKIAQAKARYLSVRGLKGCHALPGGFYILYGLAVLCLGVAIGMRVDWDYEDSQIAKPAIAIGVAIIFVAITGLHRDLLVPIASLHLLLGCPVSLIVIMSGDAGSDHASKLIMLSLLLGLPITILWCRKWEARRERKMAENKKAVEQ
jgi:hypothetical protein